MEPNQYEDSNIGSSEATNKSDQPPNNEMDGTGRSYDCVFCKRGFTTAQALGGHMNIHRKERAKPKASSSSSQTISSKIEEGYWRSYPSFYPTHSEVHLNYQRHNPGASRWGFRPSYPQNSDVLYAQNSQHLISQLDEGWRRSNSLTLQIGIDSSGIDEEKRKREEEDDGLDLELRL